MTTGNFRYIDPASYANTTTNPSGQNKPWGKVDGPGYSFKLSEHPRTVKNIRGIESSYGTDVSGFAVHHYPSVEKDFTDDAVVKKSYYAEVEELLRAKLSGISKVVIFDHTIRRREKASPRQPVQQVHVDQTPQAAEIRVRRHVPDPAEAEKLLNGRYQIINVWRPIGRPASDFPLALVDWRSTIPDDFIKVDLLYPKEHQPDPTHSGREVLPDPTSVDSTAGYEVKGETYAVRPSEKHEFHYMKDMTPDEAMFIKCFDSRSDKFVDQGGKKGVADGTPHTAFVDPNTPADAPGRQSIEVRCLVFYD